jgi:hypothetical protein
MIAPAYVYVVVLSGMAAITIAVLLGLGRVLTMAGFPPAQRRSIYRRGSVLLLAWLALSLALGWLGAYYGTPNGIPTIQYGILGPIAVGALLLWRSATVARIIDAVPLSWLVGVQVYRALGFIFLALYASGHMPGAFALPAGIGDVAIGLLAPVVAWSYARRPAESVGLVRTWNAFGIADLVVAVTMGFLTSPSPLQLLSFGAPNELISAFPLVMVPVFAVPLSIVLHLAVLVKLRRIAASPKTGGAELDETVWPRARAAA